MVSGNTGRSGGGLTAGEATLTRCTVSGNTAALAEGGGISSGTTILTSSTVSGNTAGTVAASRSRATFKL